MDRLTLIIHTLSRVEVCGKENLSRLLGCIQELEKMKEDTHHDRDHGQRPDLPD